MLVMTITRKSVERTCQTRRTLGRPFGPPSSRILASPRSLSHCNSRHSAFPDSSLPVVLCCCCVAPTHSRSAENSGNMMPQERAFASSFPDLCTRSVPPICVEVDLKGRTDGIRSLPRLITSVDLWYSKEQEFTGRRTHHSTSMSGLSGRWKKLGHQHRNTTRGENTPRTSIRKLHYGAPPRVCTIHITHPVEIGTSRVRPLLAS